MIKFCLRCKDKTIHAEALKTTRFWKFIYRRMVNQCLRCHEHQYMGNLTSLSASKQPRTTVVLKTDFKNVNLPPLGLRLDE